MSEAVADADLAIARTPQEGASWTLRGDVRRAQGQLASALEDYAHARSLLPRRATREALYGTALVYLRQGDRARAEELARELESVAPSSSHSEGLRRAVESAAGK